MNMRILTDIIAARELLLALLRKEISVRYKQSIMGPLWAFMQPLILMALFVMIQRFVGIDSGGAPYPVVVYAALLPWTFFANSVNFATGSIVNSSPIIRKIYCPRSIFPLAAILACLYDFLIAAVLFVLLLFFYHITLSWYALLLPLLLLLQLFLNFGLTLITSSVAAYRRDVMIGMPFILQFWMFASPVMYRLESVPSQWRAFYSINPMCGILEAYRSILVYRRPPDATSLGEATLVAVLLLFAGLLIFSRLEKRFADVV
jgi:lipopolysaccharide transport system permease protein